MIDIFQTLRGRRLTKLPLIDYNYSSVIPHAEVAELVDARDLKFKK
jgi:hypothetical protein